MSPESILLEENEECFFFDFPVAVPEGEIEVDDFEDIQFFGTD